MRLRCDAASRLGSLPALLSFLLLAGPARATLGPPVIARVTGSPTAAVAGQPWRGQVEVTAFAPITVALPGDLAFANGPGGAEAFSVNITTGGWYCLAVWKAVAEQHPEVQPEQVALHRLLAPEQGQAACGSPGIQLIGVGLQVEIGGQVGHRDGFVRLRE